MKMNYFRRDTNKIRLKINNIIKVTKIKELRNKKNKNMLRNKEGPLNKMKRNIGFP
jgi:hypothetical protein